MQKKRGEPKTAGNIHNGNVTANSTQSIDDVGDVFAGMVICYEINEAMQVDESTEEWLDDSGASAHITNSDYRMTNM